MKLSTQTRSSPHINNPKLLACDRVRARARALKLSAEDAGGEIYRSRYLDRSIATAGKIYEEGKGGPARCSRVSIANLAWNNKKTKKKKKSRKILPSIKGFEEPREEASLLHRVPSLPLLTPLYAVRLSIAIDTRAYMHVHARNVVFSRVLYSFT